MTLPSRLLAGLCAVALCGASLPSMASAQSYPQPAYPQPEPQYAPEPDDQTPPPPPVDDRYGSGDRYSSDDGYAYDACHRARTERGTGGALLGAGLGALAGRGLASKGVRKEGALVGGVLGAIVGGSVGADSAACDDGYRRSAPVARYDDRYGNNGYAAYDDADDGYGDEDPQDYPPATAAGRDGADGCTLAESPVYLPDGSVQKRFVRVCQDASGRYQVVD